MLVVDVAGHDLHLLGAGRLRDRVVGVERDGQRRRAVGGQRRRGQRLVAQVEFRHPGELVRVDRGQPVTDGLLNRVAGVDGQHVAHHRLQQAVDPVDELFEVLALGLELLAPALGRQFGELPLCDVDVCDDGAPGLVVGQGRDPHQKPLLLVRGVTRVLHREQVLLAVDDRLDATEGLPGVLVRVDIGRREVVRPLHLPVLVARKLPPGAVREQDRPLVVEDSDIDRQRVQRRVSECLWWLHSVSLAADSRYTV